MPWRLIASLVVLTLVVLFAGFNISNVSDISFGFYTLTKVPVFVSLFIAFLVGTFVMVPFVFRKRNAKVSPKKSREMKQNADMEPAPAPSIPAESPPLEPTTTNTKKKRSKK